MPASSSLSRSFDAEFYTELLPGESLLWTGKPLSRIFFRNSDWYAIPFSLLWGGFAVFWELGVSGGLQHAKQSVLTQGSHFSFDFMTFWGIPFVLIGQYMIWGRFLYTAWKKTHTFYAVTDKRILVLTTGPSRKLTDGFLAGLNSVSIFTRKDGAGTINFSPEPELTGFMGSNRRNQGMQMDIRLDRLAFYDIENAREVYQTIQTERDRISSNALAHYDSN